MGRYACLEKAVLATPSKCRDAIPDSTNQMGREVLPYLLFMAFVALRCLKGNCTVMALAAGLTRVHIVHLHLLCAFLHLPYFGMAFVALEHPCMQFMTKTDR